MTIFHYSGKGHNGKAVKGYIEAETTKSARTILLEKGIVTESVKTVTFKGHFTKEARARLYSEVGMLLSSGFTLDEALSLLITERPPRDAAFLRVLKGRIMEGERLSGVVENLSGDLPGFEKAALIISEETGAQGKLLLRLADFIESERTIQGKIKAALTYPCAVLILALGLMATMVFFILPKAMQIFPGGTAPKSAVVLSYVAPIIISVILVFTGASLLFFSIMARGAKNNPAMAIRYEKILLSLPLLNRLLPLLWTSRFALTMGLLLESGLNPQTAVVPSGSSTGSEFVKQLTLSAGKDIKLGLPLSKAIAFVTPVAPHLAAWIGVGEKSGSLSKMLEKAGERARQEYEKILTHLLSLLEPALVAFVGGIVLFIALAVIKPMLDLTTKGM